MLGGYGALDSGFSLFVVNNLHMSVHIIGVVLFVNTSTIVLAQLLVVNIVEKRSRTRVLALVSTLWSVFWIALAISLHLSRVVAIIAICASMVIFALGETMLSPVGQALVNEIAPEHLRGRYNAAQGLTWGVSGSIAPAITAIFFDNHLGDWWPVCVGGLSLVGGTMMLNLRRHLTAGEDGRARPSVL
jgi:MFS family permease